MDDPFAKLRRSTAALGDAIEDALVDAIEPMAAAARRNAPRDSGELADHIKVERLPRGRNSVAVQIVVDAKDFPGGKEYVAAAEFGTAHRAAQPFMRPAFDSKARSVIRAAQARIAKIIERFGAP